ADLAPVHRRRPAFHRRHERPKDRPGLDRGSLDAQPRRIARRVAGREVARRRLKTKAPARGGGLLAADLSSGAFSSWAFSKATRGMSDRLMPMSASSRSPRRESSRRLAL